MGKIERLLNPLNVKIRLRFNEFGFFFINLYNVLVQNGIDFIFLKLNIVNNFRLNYCFEVIVLALGLRILWHFDIILVIVLNTHRKLVLLTHVNGF